MPGAFDLLTSKIQAPNPADLLRNAIGQQQGKTLGGLGTPDMAAKPQMPSVLGPLAALAGKPRIRQYAAVSAKPRIKLKTPGGFGVGI